MCCYQVIWSLALKISGMPFRYLWFYPMISHLVDWNLVLMYNTWVASTGQADVQSNNTDCYYVANQVAEFYF